MAAGKAAKTQATVNKVVEINKQALAQIQASKFEAARDALWGASRSSPTRAWLITRLRRAPTCTWPRST